MIEVDYGTLNAIRQRLIDAQNGLMCEVYEYETTGRTISCSTVKTAAGTIREALEQLNELYKKSVENTPANDSSTRKRP
jgi:hypothetical protein